ncbi:MAG: AMP-binding protein [Synechococcaceae cyanobacterium RL_1_2]|nr:AMP-binding protein [Synechococcaceae cyanobacterium RL_1_2]
MNFPLINRAITYQNRVAIVTSDHQYSYHELLTTSAKIAAMLLGEKEDLQETRVAFLVPSGFDYVAVQWGIWRAGAIAVPLCIAHPRPELAYAISEVGATILIAHPQFADIARSLATEYGCQLFLTSELETAQAPKETKHLPSIDPLRGALILFTSGTTGKPKGVVITHRNIEAQVTSLVEAWGWTKSDRILHVLPLHHIHGIVNVLTCALWVGAQCHMMPQFNAAAVWDKFTHSSVTLFMAVPTIYVKLINHWQTQTPEQQALMRAGAKKLRLMVSGSAALPVTVLEQWRTITNHLLLERYGMTEIGMALSNPLEGDRLAGFVGKPLPGVEARLVNDQGQITQQQGEIQIKGPHVFREYWQRPEATTEAFTPDGWFRTGDMAGIEGGNYRILGRMSVDIIKTGGYKVSALEIEETLRTHPAINDCAVVGVPDEEWGERVCAGLILNPDYSEPITLASLRRWGKERLAVYKIPTQIAIVADLPRNVMGKVTKPRVKKLF